MNRWIWAVTMFLLLLSAGITETGFALETKEDPGKPRLVPQLGHSSIFTSFAFSSDGHLVLSGSDDNTLKLWDVATGKLLRTFTGHVSSVNSVTISQNSRYAVSCTNDAIMLWEINTGVLIKTIKSESKYCSAIALSPDTRYLLTGSSTDGTLTLLDIATGQSARTFKGHDGSVTAVAFSADGRHIISGSSDNTIKLWGFDKNELIKTLTGHTGEVSAINFSPDGKYALSGSGQDNTIILWNLNSGKSKVYNVNFDSIKSIAFSPNGRYFLSGTAVTFSLRDIASGALIKKYQGHVDLLQSVKLSSDGSRAIISGALGLSLWDFSSGKEQKLVLDPGNLVKSAAISPNNQYVLYADVSNSLKLLDISTKSLLKVFTGHSARVRSVAFSPDGRHILSGSDDNTLKLWSTSDGVILQTFTGHSGRINSVAFSLDGQHVLSSSDDKTLKLWRISDGVLVKTFTGHSSRVTSAIFNSDGSFILSGSWDNTVKLWNTFSGELKRTFTRDSFVPLDSNYINTVSFAHGGSYVLSGAHDKNLKVWDIYSGNHIKTLYGHLDKVTSIAVLPVNNQILSASWDGTTKLWSTATGKLLGTLYSFTDNTWAVVDPEGRFDASNGGNVKGLHWVVGNEPIDLAQLKDRYYDPGLLAKIMGFNKEPLRSVPDLATSAVILFPEVAVDIPKESAKAKITLKNRGGGIGKVRVLVNGSEYLADARGDKKAPDAKEQTIELDLSGAPLNPNGDNSIQVFAYNTDGSEIRSRGTPVRFATPKREKIEPATLHAVIIGTSKYANPEMNLTYSGKDAVDFAKAIQISARRLFGVERVKITLLSDYETIPLSLNEGIQVLPPTRKNIEAAFADAQKSNFNDIFLLYLSGHGVTTGGDRPDYYYLLNEARSAKLEDPALRDLWAISSSRLTDWITGGRIKANKKAVIIDTCGAGGAAKKLAEARNLSGSQIIALEIMKDRTGFFILMGAAADKESLEATRYGQGLLTYALLEGMKTGKGLDDNSNVDVRNLFRYTENRVPALAKGVGGIQQPKIFANVDANSFFIGQITAADRAAIPYNPEKPVILRATFQQTAPPIDTLKLTPLVNARLKETSSASRGNTPFVFIADDEFPGAFQMSGSYKKNGDSVSVEVYLTEGEKQKNFSITGKTADLPGLAREIVEKAAQVVRE